MHIFIVAIAAAAVVGGAQASWPSEAPFFPKYPTRSLQVLDGTWNFGFTAPHEIDPVTVSPARVYTPNKTTVPSNFDVAQPGVVGRRGTGWYRTRFDLSPGSHGLVQITACAFYCRVFIDDVDVGEHRAGGYAPWWVAVPPSSSPSRELLILSNNEWNSTRAPTYTGGDFYALGGLTRNVIVHDVGASNQFIQRVETFTTQVDVGMIDVNVVLGGNAAKSASARLSFAFPGSPSRTLTLPVKNGVAQLTNVTVPNPRPWTLDDPNLHNMTVTLESSGDSVVVRFGLRVVSAVGGRIAINGKAVKLHGVNRHTLWPDTGAAVTLEQIKADVALLRELGANYVRGAHYPQDQRFLDICDEVGIAVWEEALGPGVKTDNLLDPSFMQQQVIAVNEMVSASINHPSVVLHAFYNEGPSGDPKACPGYNTSASVIRSRVGSPPSRLVTWASDRRTADVCLGIADVISFNDYPGWYVESGEFSKIAGIWKTQIDWAVEHFPDKPVTISETGAGGVFEWTNSSVSVKWGQAFQDEVVHQDVSYALTDSRLSGITVWQFSDIKADDAVQTSCGPCDYAPHPPSLSAPWNCAYINVNCSRPGGCNHKGQVDMWRRKKSSFATLAALYNSSRVVEE